MMRVAFINENTLGHASYLLPFVDWFRRHPALGIEPELINATPLPPELDRRANARIRGLHRIGLDRQAARWRMAASTHARMQLNQLRATQPIHAVVVNTQSVALRLAGIADVVPLFVCLDATFAQLSRSPWFAPNALSRLFLPLTLGGILQQEKKLFQLAHALLPWSDCANASLRTDYALAKEQVHVLPPSLELPPRRASRPRNAKPSLLFVGGDFRRKGGPLLLKCFREHLAGRAELHIVTQSDVAPEPDVFVHRGLQAHSAAWHERWEQADVFVFPSTLETFGIVLLEALAFEVPVISANVGAAAEILENDDAGILLDKCDAASLTAALEELLNPSASAARVERGRIRIEKDFNLETNAARLAGWLREAG